MEYTQEFLTGLYGTYMGCPVMYQGSDGIPDPVFYDSTKDDYSFEFILTGLRKVYYGDYILYGKMVVDGETVEDIETSLSDTKLLLKPRLDISDTDAIDLCKIVHAGELLNDEWDLSVGSRDGDVIRIERWLLEDGQRYPLTDLILNLSNPEYKDYLRGYALDCGFAHLNSLIDAGLAIDKTTLK